MNCGGHRRVGQRRIQLPQTREKRFLPDEILTRDTKETRYCLFYNKFNHFLYDGFSLPFTHTHTHTLRMARPSPREPT